MMSLKAVPFFSAVLLSASLASAAPGYCDKEESPKDAMHCLTKGAASSQDNSMTVTGSAAKAIFLSLVEISRTNGNVFFDDVGNATMAVISKSALCTVYGALENDNPALGRDDQFTCYFKVANDGSLVRGDLPQ